ncbi:toxin-antitoxin system YwqK family antitoxin [Lishizhenia sp.]|uniref:toxin-antitoxin system YwqK family antitoxin n=1 Tax=Lishizhenia sp. TaxID=2497594 RepID=UPI00299E2C1E|nr:toxin-antitoxin system YwqK family antitoxin [Lishizhenia sp.]MDX1445530.1 toxin-antitoxin system YwqK family antitoxin [Lishizhenia sp.]
MKNWILLVLVIMVQSFVFGQMEKLGEPCYQKTLDRKEAMKKSRSRYVEWECGKDPEIVDCNQALQLDPETERVYTNGSANDFSTGGQLFTGYCESCHDNGIRKRLVYFENGLQNGKDTTYYESGCPLVVTSYIAGKENGTWTKFFDSSGYVAWEINFLDNKKHGRSIYFAQYPNGEDRNGHPRYTIDTLKIESFVNGILDGTKKEFYKDSKIKREVNYKMGELHGAFKTYGEDGTLLEDLNFEDGEKEGEQKYYYDNGAPLRTENWKKHLKEGNFTTFYIQGHVQKSEVYKKGQKHGWFEERFPDNSIKRRALYEKDVLIEEHVFDKYGNEIKTFGVEEEENAAEDDAMPTEKGKKKRKRKKKRKEAKEEE